MEMRYHTEEGKIDLGVFAPVEMMGVREAEGLIREFIRSWV